MNNKKPKFKIRKVLPFSVYLYRCQISHWFFRIDYKRAKLRVVVFLLFYFLLQVSNHSTPKKKTILTSKYIWLMMDETNTVQGQFNVFSRKLVIGISSMSSLLWHSFQEQSLVFPVIARRWRLLKMLTVSFAQSLNICSLYTWQTPIPFMRSACHKARTIHTSWSVVIKNLWCTQQ